MDNLTQEQIDYLLWEEYEKKIAIESELTIEYYNMVCR